MLVKLPLGDQIEDASPLSAGRSQLSPDIEATTVPLPDQLPPPLRKWSTKLELISGPIGRLHKKTPFLKTLPPFVIFPISIVVIVNCAVWAIVAIVLRYHPYISSRLS